jgi:hypothetical protein
MTLTHDLTRLVCGDVVSQTEESTHEPGVRSDETRLYRLYNMVCVHTRPQPAVELRKTADGQTRHSVEAEWNHNTHSGPPSRRTTTVLLTVVGPAELLPKQGSRV